MMKNEDTSQYKLLPEEAICMETGISIVGPKKDGPLLLTSRVNNAARKVTSTSAVRGRFPQSVDILLKFLLCVSVVCAIIATTNQLYLRYTRPGFSPNSGATLYVDGILKIQEGRVNQAACDIEDNNLRFDCHPGLFASQKSCEARGCCWRPPSQTKVHGQLNQTDDRSLNIPYCFYPSGYSSFTAGPMNKTKYGYSIVLTNTLPAKSWPGNLEKLQLDIYVETDSRLHFKIIDPKSVRYEVPVDTPKVDQSASNTQYEVVITKQPFGMVVKRKSTGSIVFDSTMAPLLYSDQLLQLSTSVPSGMLYGLGEHRGAFLQNMSTWRQMTFWTRDQPPVTYGNLYGVHPFFTSLEADGNAYGVFLLNSNAMEVDLQPLPAITYRTIGGVLDFYVLLGPTPGGVVQQYAQVVGRPNLPPYWALGFHLCRWGYNTTAGLRAVVDRMRKAGFPYDVQWMDIDYMRNHLDWTYDTQRFAGLPDLVQDLHNNDQHLVLIVDPGISNQHPGNYPPYDEGLMRGVFVRDSEGNPIVGQVWPGTTVYPDFTNPNTTDWWFNEAKKFHSKIPFDGLWTDMNEPSNFVEGSTKGCTENSFDVPPYTPGVIGGRLAAKTLCPSAEHHLGVHYNLHSLYGHFEAKASHAALEKLRNKRAFVITRSSYAGTGKYAGHWSGDNWATWNDLYYSIPEMLNFQLFSMPMVGADTCGFTGPTTEELCTRWSQLAAFYPFMRNHNMIGNKPQDPASFTLATQRRIRSALVLRYSLLPYLYTLLYHSHSRGGTVVNPLSFIYPKDPATHGIDRQFMWGTGLLVSPATRQGQTSVNAYLPTDTWYKLSDGTKVAPGGRWVNLPTPIDSIQVHIRGGSIIPLQEPGNETTTVQARKNPFSILVVLDESGGACGDLYWDDGETINSTEEGLYTLISFTAQSDQLTSEVQRSQYRPSSGMFAETITVLGVEVGPDKVTLNGKSVDYEWNTLTKVLVVSHQHIDLLQIWRLRWK